MLLIQAIGFLIDKIDEHLASRLQVDKPQVDARLAQILRVQFEETTPRIPSSLLRLPETAEQPSSSSSSRSSSSSSSFSPSSSSSSSIPSSSSSSSSASVETEWSGFSSVGNVANSVSTQLPLELGHKKDFDLFSPAISSASTSPEGVQLRLVGRTGPRTWGQLMHSPYDELKYHLENDLKSETFTDKKMIILARFKRQVFVLGEKARSSLLAREKESAKPFEDGVDAWLVKMAETAINEAIELITLCQRQESYQFSLLSIKPRAGETEVILSACLDVLKSFSSFCELADQKRKKTKQMYGSMVDVLPSTMTEAKPLTIVNQEIAQYVVHNLFEQGMYSGYGKNGLGVPFSYYAYDIAIAKEKLRVIQENLLQFDLAVADKAINSEDYWSELLKVPHRLSEAVVAVTPRYTLMQQSYNTLCGGLHTSLRTQASPYAPKTAREHMNCPF